MSIKDQEPLLPQNGIERFVRNPIAGAALLLGAAAVALAWANSSWAPSYFAWLNTTFSVAIGDVGLTKPVQLWINDGLMAVFFFVVGLEIKREFIAGELRTWRQAAFPLTAAMGGMLVPATIYLAFNAGTETARGWGVPMATDIAFALGVLAILGRRVPLALKVFLTAVAIVDDVGAIAVIAFFYTDAISITALATGFGLLGIGMAGNVARVGSWAFYAVVGIGVWLAFLASGVHATLAAVLLAFVIPARTPLNRETLVEFLGRLNVRLRNMSGAETRPLLSHTEHYTLSEVGAVAQHGTPMLQRLEHSMAPFVTLVVLPIFALANAGVTIGAANFAEGEMIVPGVALGLVLGNPIGITGFSWLAVRLGIASLPTGVSWRQVLGAASLAGIGFTMSMFISGLAFSSPEQQELAKLGILGGSLVSGILGSTLLLTARQTE